MKLVLLYFVKAFEYFFDMLAVYKHVIRINEYIIQIGYDTDIQKIRKNTIHELLKDHGSIGKAK